jgi:hypothetical protein
VHRSKEQTVLNVFNHIKIEKFRHKYCWIMNENAEPVGISRTSHSTGRKISPINCKKCLVLWNASGTPATSNCTLSCHILWEKQHYILANTVCNYGTLTHPLILRCVRARVWECMSLHPSNGSHTVKKHINEKPALFNISSKHVLSSRKKP